MTARRSIDVVSKLLGTMEMLVTDYGDLIPTPVAASELIDGTAFFPGGTGLWRGDSPHGRLPEYFPKSPIMFVGNYWYNEAGFKRDKRRGSEEFGVTGMWASMLAYIRVCRLHVDQCFFTNALMGLTPGNGPTRGRLEGDGPTFRSQCRLFFDRQVEIVGPRLVVVMGVQAELELRDFEPKITVPHPASLQAKPEALDAGATKKVARLIEALSGA